MRSMSARMTINLGRTDGGGGAGAAEVALELPMPKNVDFLVRSIAGATLGRSGTSAFICARVTCVDGMLRVYQCLGRLRGRGCHRGLGRCTLWNDAG